MASNSARANLSMRRLIHLAALLLTVCNVQAQVPAEPSTYIGTPPSEVVLKWLYSPDPRLQAWAAHDILLADATDFVPELQAQLERTTLVGLNDASGYANFRSTVAILDTLIQFDATVPVLTLERTEKLGYGSQTEELVLLSRLPREEAEPMLRAFYRPGIRGDFAKSAASRVAAQMLAQHAPKGFAAELLSTIVVTAQVIVTDGNAYAGVGGGGSGMSCGGTLPMSGWPEIGRYTFRDPPTDKQALPPDETLFLPGPDPVYLLRLVSRTYDTAVCDGFSGLNDAIRSHLVGTLLNGAPESPFPEQPVTLHITFHSRQAYRAQVQAFVDKQQENFNQVAATLTAMDLLTEEERQAASLRVNLSVQDLRIHPVGELPDLAFRPPVQWVPRP